MENSKFGQACNYPEDDPFANGDQGELTKNQSQSIPTRIITKPDEVTDFTNSTPRTTNQPQQQPAPKAVSCEIQEPAASNPTEIKTKKSREPKRTLEDVLTTYNKKSLSAMKAELKKLQDRLGIAIKVTAEKEKHQAEIQAKLDRKTRTEILICAAMAFANGWPELFKGATPDEQRNQWTAIVEAWTKDSEVRDAAKTHPSQKKANAAKAKIRRDHDMAMRFFDTFLS